MTVFLAHDIKAVNARRRATYEEVGKEKLVRTSRLNSMCVAMGGLADAMQHRLPRTLAAETSKNKFRPRVVPCARLVASS